MSEAELHDMVGEQVEDLTQHDLSLRNTEKIEYDEFVNLLKSVRKDRNEELFRPADERLVKCWSTADFVPSSVLSTN